MTRQEELRRILACKHRWSLQMGAIEICRAGCGIARGSTEGARREFDRWEQRMLWRLHHGPDSVVEDYREIPEKRLEINRRIRAEYEKAGVA